MKGCCVCFECAARQKGYSCGKEMVGNLYWTKGKTLKEMARIIGVSEMTIYDRMKMYNVPTRLRGGKGRA